MTQIYVIENPAQTTKNYVCNSQETIDAIKTAGYDGIFSVGGQLEANEIFAANQQAWLIKNLNIFTVNKKIITPNGIVWEDVDLTKEPDNTDVIYTFYNVPNGDHVDAVGLLAANALLAQIKQNYLNFSGLNSYITQTSIPEPLTIKVK